MAKGAYGRAELDDLLNMFAMPKALENGTVVLSLVDKMACRFEWDQLKMRVQARHRACKSTLEAWQMVHREFGKLLPNLIKLVSICLVLPLSTAIVERSFSIRNNVVVTKTRNRMAVETSDRVMRIMLNSPAVFDFDGSHISVREGSRGRPAWHVAGQRLVRRAIELWNGQAKYRQGYTYAHAVRETHTND